MLKIIAIAMINKIIPTHENYNIYFTVWYQFHIYVPTQ